MPDRCRPSLRAAARPRRSWRCPVRRSAGPQVRLQRSHIRSYRVALLQAAPQSGCAAPRRPRRSTRFGVLVVLDPWSGSPPGPSPLVSQPERTIGASESGYGPVSAPTTHLLTTECESGDFVQRADARPRTPVTGVIFLQQLSLGVAHWLRAWVVPRR